MITSRRMDGITLEALTMPDPVAPGQVHQWGKRHGWLWCPTCRADALDCTGPGMPGPFG